MPGLFLYLERRTAMIKLVACLTVLLAINSSPALAASRHCANIKPGSERQACEDGSAKSIKPGSIAAKREPGLSDNAKMIDSVELLKQEDDRVAKRLQGICRGC
jgi:hypothetical protein